MEKAESFYLFFQKKLIEWGELPLVKKGNNKMDFIELKKQVHFLRLPKSLYMTLFNEMEKLGLVKWIDRYTLEVINPERCKDIRC